MERPFPYVLVIILAVLIYGAFAVDGGWVQIGAIVAIGVVVAAVIYQFTGAGQDDDR